MVGEFGVWQAAQHMENASMVRGLGMFGESGKSIRENWWGDPKKEKTWCDPCLFFILFLL